jgi:cell wall assembly regulator SMI1
MKDLLKRLDQWLAKNYPDLGEDLHPGTDDVELEGLEESLGLKLPDDFKTLLKWHNGQDGAAAGLFGNWVLLPAEDVLQEWTLWKELLDKGHFEESHDLVKNHPAIKQRWWHPSWIPISSDGMGNNHCLDLSPEPGGKIGQIITLFHDNEERTVLAPSLKEWMHLILDKLENGTYTLVMDEEVQDYFFEPEGFIE